MGDGEVPRLSHSEFSQDAFVSRRTKSQPLVLPGLAASWPSFSRWTDEYLIEAAGDETITVMSRTDYSGAASKRVEETSRDVTLRELLDLVQLDDPPDLSYVRQTRLLQSAPQLREDIQLPAALEGAAQPEDALMWLGPKDTVAQMHWDSADNLFVQLRGKKQFILVSPDESHLTYPNQFLAQEVAEAEAFQQRFPDFASKLAQLAERYRDQQAPAEFFNELSVIERVILYQLLASFNNCHVNAQAADQDKHPLFQQANRWADEFRIVWEM